MWPSQVPLSPFQNADVLLAALMRPGTLLEVGLFSLAGLGALLLVQWLRVSTQSNHRSVWFGQRGFDGVLFPLLLLVLAWLIRWLLERGMPVPFLRLAAPVLLSLLLIRSAVKVLQLNFANGPMVRVFEQSISWLVWIALALWMTGLLPAMLTELEEVSWKVGSAHLNLRIVLEGIVTSGAVMVVTLWISSGIEARLLRDSSGSELSLRKAASNATRGLLLFVGLMVAMAAVGIDITTLSFLGGAIGVGIGLGLQRLAANYISGFVILTERNLRIGDHVCVDGFEGRITAINARYTVVQAATGRESVLPNEMLITQRVENFSLASPHVFQTTTVVVGLKSDVALVQSLLLAAAVQQKRVLKDPAPAVMLSSFTPIGLEFTVAYWLADLENGQGNLRSDVNLTILESLRARGVSIALSPGVLA